MFVRHRWSQSFCWWLFLRFPRENAAADYECGHDCPENPKLHRLHCGVLRRSTPLRAIIGRSAYQVLRTNSCSFATLAAIRRMCGTGIGDVGCHSSPAAALPKASVAEREVRSRLKSEGSAAMPDQPLHFPSERETVVTSILKSRLDLRRLQFDLHNTISLSREMISRSLDLIAKADKVLARK